MDAQNAVEAFLAVLRGEWEAKGAPETFERWAWREYPETMRVARVVGRGEARL